VICSNCVNQNAGTAGEHKSRQPVDSRPGCEGNCPDTFSETGRDGWQMNGEGATCQHRSKWWLHKKQKMNLGTCLPLCRSVKGMPERCFNGLILHSEDILKCALSPPAVALRSARPRKRPTLCTKELAEFAAFSSHSERGAQN
jgi:hypothetical protein